MIDPRFVRTRMTALASLTVICALAPAPLLAQNATPDAKRGAEIAAQGTPNGAPACVSCHDVNGNPDGSGTFPRLFGLPAAYIAKQIGDYKNKTRVNGIMAPVADKLSAQDIADVAAYYAVAKQPFPKTDRPDRAALEAGQILAVHGNEAKKVPACNNCHGPGGAGEPPALPPLAGQFAPYIVAQLQAWQRGERKNDNGAQMSAWVRNLDDADIRGVAAYYQQVVRTMAQNGVQNGKPAGKP